MSDQEKIMLPEVMVFAGPNGSGKSTITRMAKTVGIYINADDIRKSITSKNKFLVHSRRMIVHTQGRGEK